MKKLNFADGTKEYELPNGNTLRFVPSDINIITRYNEMRPKLEANESEYSEIESDENKLAALDTETREIINYIFGADVCTPAFGGTHCMTPVNGGFLAFELMNVLLEEVNEAVHKEGDKMKKNISKYTNQLPK